MYIVYTDSDKSQIVCQPLSSHLLLPLAAPRPGRPEREERLRAVGIIPRP